MGKNTRNKKMKRSDDPGHRRFRQFGQLGLLAERLNANYQLANSHHEPELQETYAVYKIIEKIVSEKSLTQAAKQFTTYAAAHPIKLEVGIGRMAQTGEETAIPALSKPPDEITSALGLLWRSYFLAQG